jgi:hypothetical protein
MIKSKLKICLDTKDLDAIFKVALEESERNFG